MNAFFVALSFLTRFPVPRRTDFNDWSCSAAYYPAVGWVIGSALILFQLLVADHFPPEVGSVLLLVFWVWLTGGLHLDGLMDTADGLGANRDPEQTLGIMKDSRVGAMGVLTCLLLLLLKGAALASVPGSLWVPLLIVPVVARWVLLAAICYYPYISRDGIGTGLRDGLTGVSWFLATLLTVVLVGVVSGWTGVLFPIVGLLFLWWFGRMIQRRIGGFTGDAYGALVEGTEGLLLLLWLLV